MRKSFLIDAIILLINPSDPVWPYETLYDWAKRKKHKDYSSESYQKSLWKLQRRGFLKVMEKNGKRFIKLTKDGELELLLRKARIAKIQDWDGKWRLIIFDIPESSRQIRDNFRSLLKQNNFVKLQASVFISPYPLNADALLYLEKTGLIQFIRIIRADALDNDTDLRRKFNLPSPKISAVK